jgi:hypothetical protein
LLATREKLLYASPDCAWALPSEWLRMPVLALTLGLGEAQSAVGF